MKNCLLLAIIIASVVGCQAKPKIDMSTDVEVIHGAEPMKLGEILQPFPKTLPANLVSFVENTSCKMLRANGGAILANITSYEGGKSRAPMYFIKPFRYIENQGTPEREVKTAYTMAKPEVTDVIVTETSKPVSLLLTSHDPTLWVVHTTPGVKLQNINVMSYEGAAVIAPQVQKSQINFLINTKRNRKCWNKPVRYKNAKDMAAAKTNKNYKRTSKDYERYRQEEKGYKQWLGWVGQKVGRVSIALDREYYVHAALVGTPPPQPIEATPLGGEIYVDHSRGNIFWGSKKDAQKVFPPPPRR